MTQAHNYRFVRRCTPLFETRAFPTSSKPGMTWGTAIHWANCLDTWIPQVSERLVLIHTHMAHITMLISGMSGLRQSLLAVSVTFQLL